MPPGAELIDGFKRLAAARVISGMSRVSVRVILVDERGAKATNIGLAGPFCVDLNDKP